MASVPPRYRRFFALTDPAATLWPSVAVAGAYLAPGYFSPGPGGLHQFQCNPSLRAAVLTPPESVAAISQRSSAPDAAFAVPLAARLPEFIITGLAQRSIPAARSVTPQPHRRVRQEVPRRAFATPTRLLSFTAPWPLPCRDFHSLGCTAFLLVTQWKRSFRMAASRSRRHHARGARMTPLPGALTTIETRRFSEVASSQGDQHTRPRSSAAPQSVADEE